MRQLVEGEKAPDFKGISQNGKNNFVGSIHRKEVNSVLLP